MGTKMKNDSSTRAWYIIYQIYTTIRKIYKGIQRQTRIIFQNYVIKTEIKERGSFY